MLDIITKIEAVPENVLSKPGKNWLEEIVQLNNGWAIDVCKLGGGWYLVEKDRNGYGRPTPIEVFDLVESNDLFC